MVTRNVIASAITTATIAVAPPAGANEPTWSPAEADCASIYERAQDRLRSSALLEARDLFSMCDKMECGVFLQHACRAARTRLETEDLPTIVLRVADPAGTIRPDVRITMDGHVLTSRIDGKPVPVDPGFHEFIFWSAGRTFATTRILVGQGQRNRVIAPSTRDVSDVGRLDTATPPGRGFDPDRPATHRSIVPYALATGGLTGAAAVTLLLLRGKTDTSSVITDASIGLSSAASILAIWLFVAGRPGTAPGRTDAGLIVDVRPSSSGVVASLMRTF